MAVIDHDVSCVQLIIFINPSHFVMAVIDHDMLCLQLILPTLSWPHRAMIFDALAFVTNDHVAEYLLTDMGALDSVDEFLECMDLSSPICHSCNKPWR